MAGRGLRGGGLDERWASMRGGLCGLDVDGGCAGLEGLR